MTDDEVRTQTLAAFQRACQNFGSEAELGTFAATLAGASIGLMRGLYGDEFVAAFLRGAEAEPVTIMPVRTQ